MYLYKEDPGRDGDSSCYYLGSFMDQVREFYVYWDGKICDVTSKPAGPELIERFQELKVKDGANQMSPETAWEILTDYRLGKEIDECAFRALLEIVADSKIELETEATVLRYEKGKNTISSDEDILAEQYICSWEGQLRLLGIFIYGVTGQKRRSESWPANIWQLREFHNMSRTSPPTKPISQEIAGILLYQHRFDEKLDEYAWAALVGTLAGAKVRLVL